MLPLFLVAAASACTDPSRPAGEEGLVPLTVSVGELRVSVLVPPGTTVADSLWGNAVANDPRQDERSASLFFPSSPRVAKGIFLSTASDPLAEGVSPSSPGRLPLLKGAVLDYALYPDVGGGSGGIEGRLRGTLRLAGRTIQVSCHDQGEGGVDPAWCVPYLHHLSIVQEAERAQ